MSTRTTTGKLDAGETSTTTDSQGRYRLQAEAGDYTVRADFSGVGFVSGTGGSDVTVVLGEEVDGGDFAGQDLPAPNGLDMLPVSDTGSVSNDNITAFNNGSADTRMQFRVVGLRDGAEVRLFRRRRVHRGWRGHRRLRDCNDQRGAVVGGRPQQITATQTVAGFTSGPSPILDITIDTTPPGAITTAAPDTAEAGVLFTYDPSSPDEGAAGVEYSLSGAPSNMTIDPDAGLVSWTPTTEQAVPTEFTIVLSDTAGNSVSQEVGPYGLARPPRPAG